MSFIQNYSHNLWIQCHTNKCYNSIQIHNSKCNSNSKPSKILWWCTELLKKCYSNCNLKLIKRLLLWPNAKMRNRKENLRLILQRMRSKRQMWLRVRWILRSRSRCRMRKWQQVCMQLRSNICQRQRFHNIQDSQMLCSHKLRLASINQKLQELEVLLLILCSIFLKMHFNLIFKYSSNRCNNSSHWLKSRCSKQWLERIASARNSMLAWWTVPKACLKRSWISWIDCKLG